MANDRCSCVDDEKRCPLHGTSTPAYTALQEENVKLRERVRWLEEARDVYFAEHGSSAECAAKLAAAEKKALKAELREEK